jgi:hypothetical protein
MLAGQGDRSTRLLPNFTRKIDQKQTVSFPMAIDRWFRFLRDFAMTLSCVGNSSTRPKRIKVIALICSIYLCLFLGVLLPSHTHSDGRDHPTCPLCGSQTLTVDHPEVFVLSMLAAPVLTLQVLEPKVHFQEAAEFSRNRSPPSSLI